MEYLPHTTTRPQTFLFSLSVIAFIGNLIYGFRGFVSRLILKIVFFII